MSKIQVYDEFLSLKMFCRLSHKRLIECDEQEKNSIFAQSMRKISSLRDFNGTQNLCLLNELLTAFSSTSFTLNELKDDGSVSSKKQSYIQMALQIFEQGLTQTDQVNSLSDDDINQYLEQLSGGSKYLSDPQNILSSPILYTSHIIEGHPLVCGLTEAQFLTKEIFVKYIIASANETGGGVLICGTNPYNPNQIQGLSLSEGELKKCKEYIEQILSNFPKNQLNCQYDLVRVGKDYRYQSSSEQLNERFCIRIRVSTVQGNRLIFYKFENKGNVENQIIFKLKKQKVYNQIYYRPVEIEMNRLTQIIQEHRKRYTHYSKTSLNIYDNLRCEYPITQEPFQKIYHDKPTTPPHKSQVKSEKVEYSLITQQPKLPFQNKSLLIVGSEKKVVLIEKLKGHLTQIGHKFSIERPFYDIIKKSGPVIFSFSYDTKVTVMRETIRQFDQNKNITIIPICLLMKVETKKFIKKSDQFKDFMGRWYAGSLAISECQGKDEYSIQSNNLNAVLLGYYWFQSQGIRPCLFNAEGGHKKIKDKDPIPNNGSFPIS